MSTTSPRARSTGPRRTSAGSSATPTSSTRLFSTGARRCSTRGSPSGHLTQARSGASSPSTGSRTLFTAPTAFRAIRQQDPEGEHIGRHDLSGFRTLFLAGERCDPATLEWAEQKLGVPVIDHWWQTETGWAIAANCLGIERLPVVPGSPTRAAPGWDLRVLDNDGAELPPGETGALVVKLPMPPGASPTLWNADERYRETYLDPFPGHYLTADAGYVDERGLRLRDGPHRRHHQRRRPPSLDGSDRGGARSPRGRRRVRRDRRRRRA